MNGYHLRHRGTRASSVEAGRAPSHEASVWYDVFADRHEASLVTASRVAGVRSLRGGDSNLRSVEVRLLKCICDSSRQIGV